MAAFKELQAQITRLQEQAVIARKAEVKEAIATIHQQRALYGLTVDDLGDGAGKPAKTRSAKPTVAAKHRDPASGKTWSGRGRAPLWLKGEAAQYLTNT